MPKSLTEKRPVAGGNSENPTRRAALAKLGMISVSTLLAAEILTPSSNDVQARGIKKVRSSKHSKSNRSRTRLKPASEIDQTFCDTDSSGPLIDVLCDR